MKAQTPNDPENLWQCAVDASQQAEGIREIVRRLAESCDDGSFELRYCFESLERLLALLHEVLSEQLCAGLLDLSTIARKAEEGHS